MALIEREKFCQGTNMVLKSMSQEGKETRFTTYNKNIVLEKKILPLVIGRILYVFLFFN